VQPCGLRLCLLDPFLFASVGQLQVGVMLGCVCSFGSSSASLFGSWVACPGVGRQPVTNSFFVYQPRVVSGLSQFWPVRCTWLVVVAVFLWLVLTASVMEGIASNFIIENAGTCRDRLGTSISSRNAHYSPSLVSFFSCSGPFGPLTLFCCFFGSSLFSALIFCAFRLLLFSFWNNFDSLSLS